MTPKTKSTRTVSSSRTTSTGLATLVKEVSAFLDKTETRLGPEPPSLTSEEKKHASKPRKGAEKIITTLAPIVQQHGLESSSLSAASMMSRLSDAQTLQPLQTRLQKIQKRVDDELFSAHGDAWSMGLQFYSLMKSRAKGDGELATSLEPISKMFGYRHHSVTQTKPSKVQTRAKAKLKDAMALAARNDVGLPAPVAVTPTAGPSTGGAAGQSAPAPAASGGGSAVPVGQYVPVATLAMATGSPAQTAPVVPAAALVAPATTVTTAPVTASGTPAVPVASAAPAAQ